MLTTLEWANQALRREISVSSESYRLALTVLHGDFFVDTLSQRLFSEFCRG